MPKPKVEIRQIEAREGYYLIVYKGHGRAGYRFVFEGPYINKGLAEKRLAEQGFKNSTCNSCGGRDEGIFKGNESSDFYNAIIKRVSLTSPLPF